MAMRKLALFVLAAALPLHAQQENPGAPMRSKALGSVKLPVSKIPPSMPLSPRERALQMLNRFTFGPRPGDVDAVMAVGPDKWFEKQMDPLSIPDPSLDKYLAPYPTLKMPAQQIVTVFPDIGYITQVYGGRLQYPADPLQASMFDVAVYKWAQSQDDKNHPHPPQTDAEIAAAKKANQAEGARVAAQLFMVERKDRFAAFDALPPAERIAFLTGAPQAQRDAFAADLNPRESESYKAQAAGGPASQNLTQAELAEAHIVRSIETERQLQEVMTEFWFNHFNIYAPKAGDAWYTTTFERDTIRPHTLGKFRELLLATAESPAMMVYLDNYLSIGPDSLANGVDPKKPASKPGKQGLNENYGREIMELHTVGVNGGYSQADVTHLSAILTGWGVDHQEQGGPFKFDINRHEPGTKQWFGFTIDEDGRILSGPAGQTTLSQGAQAAINSAPEGMKQGVAALSLLSASPRTAHFISYLLAQRFIADQPPASLVDRMSATFLSSDGDIKAVLRTMTQSSEFNSHRYFRNKVKLPDEYLASAFRATGTTCQNPAAVVGFVGRQLGQPLYNLLPPTGYYITADVWMNTQSLLARLNFADQLTHNRFPKQTFDSARVLALGLMNDRNLAAPVTASGDPAKPRVLNVSTTSDPAQSGPDVALHVLESSLINGEVSTATDRFITSQIVSQPANNPTETLNLITALLLGSPEFHCCISVPGVSAPLVVDLTVWSVMHGSKYPVCDAAGRSDRSVCPVRQVDAGCEDIGAQRPQRDVARHGNA